MQPNWSGLPEGTDSAPRSRPSEVRAACQMHTVSPYIAPDTSMADGICGGRVLSRAQVPGFEALQGVRLHARRVFRYSAVTQVAGRYASASSPPRIELCVLERFATECAQQKAMNSRRNEPANERMHNRQRATATAQQTTYRDHVRHSACTRLQPPGLPSLVPRVE